MKLLLALILAVVAVSAQTPAETEQAELNRAVNENAGSQIDFIRALERHLTKHPESKQRLPIEKAIAKAATELNDNPRTVLYGEKVLTAEPSNADLALIDRVIRLLLDSDKPEPAEKALAWTKRYQRQVEALRGKAGQGHMSEGQWAEEINKAMARTLVLEARATGNLGKPEEATTLALRAWETFPGSEAARERARWLRRQGKDGEALLCFADAFTIEDVRTTHAERIADRTHMGELQMKLNKSETGLGDFVLAAFDRNLALKASRAAALRQKDPNSVATELTDFVLPRTEGTETLQIASLKGKTVVMDFWATWCAPCRIQHPLIENVKKTFEKDPSVVFLSVDSDEDRTLVPGFLKEMKWEGPSYFEAGLGRLLNIASIPTILILGPGGNVSSRMTGFIPERFEDMLTERIRDASAN